MKFIKYFLIPFCFLSFLSYGSTSDPRSQRLEGPLPEGWEELPQETGDETTFFHRPSETTHLEDPRVWNVEADPDIWGYDDFDYDPQSLQKIYLAKQIRLFFSKYFKENINKELLFRVFKKSPYIHIQISNPYLAGVLQEFISKHSISCSVKPGLWGLLYNVSFIPPEKILWTQKDKVQFEILFSNFILKESKHHTKFFMKKQSIKTWLMVAQRKNLPPDCEGYVLDFLWPQFWTLKERAKQISMKHSVSFQDACRLYEIICTQ